MVRVEPILDVLCWRGCHFVVVGSVARSLTGEPVRPRDIDIVVDASAAHRPMLVDALIDLRAHVDSSRGCTPLTGTTLLPWDWGWKTRTPFGDIDVITRFIDDTTFDDHDGRATTVTLQSGNSIRCHPTRWVG